MAEQPAASTSAASGGDTSTAVAAPAAPGPADVPTVLTTLHTLLRAHLSAHPAPSAPYLHPYAPQSPAPWKGKARAALPGPEAQADSLRRIRETLEAARGVLGKREEAERIRLARAMREVITHESALLPLGTTLSSLPPAARPLAHLCIRPPAEFLSALGQRLSIQVFTEDSQFGLLKSTLTLAGAQFVLDVELEADAPESEPPTQPASPAESGKEKEAGRGKVKLVKLEANHVKPTGEGKSEWVGRVLRSRIEAYLRVWNASHGAVTEELESAARCLEAALSELKTLDELADAANAEGADLFADLEGLAERVEAMGDRGVYAVHEGVYPAFTLLDGRGTLFRLRPRGRGESVNAPPDEGDDGMAVDGVEVETCKGDWVLEAETPLVIRRSWLTGATEEEEWSAGIKVEGLLYAALSRDSLPVFPYGTTFVHAAEVEQHWSLVSPGPEGFLFGRAVVPRTWGGMGRLLGSLRSQVVLNVLFDEAFAPGAAKGDEEEEEMVELDRAPTAIPLTATLHQRAMRVSFPSSDGEMKMLEIAPKDEAPFFSAAVEGVPVEARDADAVGIVRVALAL